MKRILPLVLALAVALFSGCGQAKANSTDFPANEGAGKLRVVSTIFPGYDFTREIAGDLVELSMLLPPGAESHSFEPTPQDIITIQNCDVFLYVGGDSDVWVDGILDSMDTSGMEVISMMDLVDVVEEEIKEGMEDDHGHDHNDDEIDPEHIQDRSLSDRTGSWISVETPLSSGDLDEYIAHEAEENEREFEAQKAAYAERWRSDYPSLEISGNGITWGDLSADYQYIGYKLVESDHGQSVWYGFETVAPSSGVPAYIAFSDHGTGGHGEDVHADETAHFHLRYGNEGFDALTEIEGWSPTYFPSGASSSEIARALSSHSHAEEEREYDEHVWTSPVNAMHIVEAVTKTLCTLDEENADSYQANASAYIGALQELDAAFVEVVMNASHDTLIFGDRFPFRYFVDAYGLDYYAAFPGCSTETEPSAKTVAFLIDKVKDEEIPAVFHIEFSNEKMADTICEATGAKKLLLHSCHNVARDDFAAGVSYLELMKNNVEALREALN